MLSFLSVLLADVSYAPVNLPFKIPAFNEVLTFFIRFFFLVAGLVALVYLLLGSLSWITSGGNKENVDKAREKIQSALIGLIILFFVLALVAVIENVFFVPGQGLGITKPIVFPGLVNPN